MAEDDLDAADSIMRVAFATARGLPDPESAFGKAQPVRSRFRAAPECAWVAEVDGEAVGSVFVARWGTFGFFGPLTIHPEHWDRGIGSRLLEPVIEAFDRWRLRQAGLFTFSNSPKHIGLYQKHGFWPRFLTALTTGPATAKAQAGYALYSGTPAEQQASLLEEARRLTGTVFAGLDLGGEILAVDAQRIGDTVLLHGEQGLDGMAVCHCGPGSEAEAGTCYVKFGAVRPGADAAGRFERLLDACESFAAGSGHGHVVAGVNTGRLDAYRRLLRRGFRIDRIGVSMCLRPEGPHFDTPDRHVIDDLR
jgi:GNAT superfamily N-acetyltransferase